MDSFVWLMQESSQHVCGSFSQREKSKKVTEYKYMYKTTMTAANVPHEEALCFLFTPVCDEATFNNFLIWAK